MGNAADAFKVVNYGKKDYHQFITTCKKCGKISSIQNYTSSNFMSVATVPLLPLGKIRVMDECSNCGWFKTLKFSEWAQQKKEKLANIARKYRKDKGNSDVLMKGIETAIEYQDEDVFQKFVKLFSATRSSNAELIGMVAYGYDYFGEYEQAEKCYRKSLQIDDYQDVRENYGLLLIKMKRPAEAEKYLEHLWTDNMGVPPEEFYHMVEAFQEEGQHDRAIGLYKSESENNPNLELDNKFKSRMKRAKTLKVTGKQFNSQLSRLEEKHDEPGAGSFILPYFVTPAIILILAGIHTGLSISLAMSRDIFLVNGLNKPYTAVINGTEFPLAEMEFKTISIPEGNLSISVKEKELKIPDTTYSIKTSYWTRPFSDKCFVINPDQAGLIVRENLYYAENIDKHPQMKPEDFVFFAGQPGYEFSSIDYPFEDPPEEILIKSNMTKRSSLYVEEYPGFLVMANAFNPQLAKIIRSPSNLETYQKFIDLKLGYEPEDASTLVSISTIFPEEQATQILTDYRDNNLDMLTYHKYYIEHKKRKSSQDEVEKEYAALLEKHPDNMNIKFCLSNLVSDSSEKIQILESIRKEHPEFKEATVELGRTYSLRGRFDESLELLIPYKKEFTEDPSLEYEFTRCLFASGKYKELVDFYQNESKVESLDSVDIYLNTAYYLVHGREKTEQYLQSLFDNEYGPGKEYEEDREYGISTLERLKNRWHYIDKDYENYIKNLKEEDKYLLSEFDIELMKNNVDMAAKHVNAKEKEMDAADSEMRTYHNVHRGRLLLYLYYTQLGDKEKAKEQFQKFMQTPEGDYSSFTGFVELVKKNPKEINPEDLLKLDMDPEEKRIVFAAVGTLLPENKKSCFELASKFNYEYSFPHHFLDDYLGVKEK